MCCTNSESPDELMVIWVSYDKQFSLSDVLNRVVVKNKSRKTIDFLVLTTSSGTVRVLSFQLGPRRGPSVQRHYYSIDVSLNNLTLN